jgi:hypothetical protein
MLTNRQIALLAVAIAGAVLAVAVLIGYLGR